MHLINLKLLENDAVFQNMTLASRLDTKMNSEIKRNNKKLYLPLTNKFYT